MRWTIRRTMLVVLVVGLGLALFRDQIEQFHRAAPRARFAVLHAIYPDGSALVSFGEDPKPRIVRNFRQQWLAAGWGVSQQMGSNRGE